MTKEHQEGNGNERQLQLPPSNNGATPRIVDLVFAGEPPAPARWLGAGIAFALAFYAGLGLVITRMGQPASAWSAEMAARVHDLISAERAFDISPPPKPPPPAFLAAKKRSVPTAARVASQLAPSRTPARPTPPAQAGKLAAAGSEPADFTKREFVVGSGTQYAGATTSAVGTARAPISNMAVPAGSPVAQKGRVPNLARPVSLDQAAWVCPWPDQADAQEIDEQTVVIRARVRADGRVDSVDVVSDPGFGFAQAARACALRTHFDPARDILGQSIAAPSPPIRVHFFR